MKSARLARRASPTPSREEVERRLERFGTDAMSFLALEARMLHWIDDGGPDATDACVAYVDTGTAWVGATGPMSDPADRSRAATRFVEAARARGRRACFFATESLDADPFARLLIGEQPILRPAEWLAALPRHGRLREQLRRARAKGVRVRRVDASELAVGSPLRLEIDALALLWLRARHMDPMAFLVSLELYARPAEHRYFVAERDGRVVEFLSAVPIYAENAWLVEDVVRASDAPNGTTETLIVALLEETRAARFVTLGLTPLSGDIAWPLRFARHASRPLFDFRGLRAFRARLHPQEWRPVWLVHPRGQLPGIAMVDSLRAFANGRLVRFAVRSIAAHPSGPPWLLAVPLAPWTLCLALLAVFGRPSVLGFGTAQRCAWVLFDALLAFALYRTALRPRVVSLVAMTLLASGDAALSVLHVASVGVGVTGLERVMRALAVTAPCLGAIVLAWATLRASSAVRRHGGA